MCIQQLRGSLPPKSLGFMTLILFMIKIEVNSLTSLTYNNCPSGFNVNTLNTSSPSPTIVNFFFSAYNNDKNINRVQNFVINGNQQDFMSYLMEMIIPFAVLAGAYFIFLMIVACCNVFEKTCPPCESWRRDFVRRPYQRLQMKCVTIFTIIFAVSTFVLSIVMFTSFPIFKQQMQNTQCSLFNALDVLTNGDQANQWGGFSQLKNQVGNISLLLTTTSNQINTNFKGFDGLSNDFWLVNNMNTMRSTNINIYKNNNASKVTTPNPATTSATPLGSPLPVVDSYFIKTGMGPNGTVNTMVTDIDAGLQVTQNFSNQAYLVEQYANILVDSAATITANTNSSEATLAMYQNQLTSFQATLTTFDSKFISLLFGWGLYVVEGVVGFILAGSVFILFGAISTHVLDILACRTLVSIGWVIYGITYFGVIALVYVFLPMGSVGNTFCNYFNQMINSQSQFNRIGQANSQNFLTKLDVCLYGNGNILQKFNLANQMQTVSQVFTSISTYNDYQNPTGVNYIDLNISINKINGWITAMQNYRKGQTIDVNPALTTDDNANISLSHLNINTKYHYVNGTLDPNCPRDVWVFDKSACTDPTAEIYVSTTNNSNGLRFTTMNDLCISLSQKLQSNYANEWDLYDFTERYQQVKQTCPAYSNIIAYGQSLINYRNSRQNLFQGLKDQLTALLGLNTQFNTNLGLYKQRVNTFYSSASTLNNLVTDQISGLLVSSNCKVVKYQLQFTYNVFCSNTLAQVATLGICSVLLLLTMIGGILTASVFSVRYSRIETVDKHSRKIIIPEGSLISETFEKKQQSESSSSSSSDED